MRFTDDAAGKKDAFYELVVYPVRGAYLANERFFAAEIARELRTKSPDTPVIGQDAHLPHTLLSREKRHTSTKN
jgi:hypothetical protein